MEAKDELIIAQLNRIEESIAVLRAESQEEFRRVYDKIGKVESKSEEIHVQTTKTNGRVNKLEEKHLHCPVANIEDRVLELEQTNKIKSTSEALKETDEYKAGVRMKMFYKVAIWIVGIAGGCGVIISGFTYLKDVL